MIELKKYSRRFVSDDMDLDNPETIEAEFDRISEMPRETPDDLEAFIAHWKDLSACVEEQGSRYYVAMTCDTTDEEAEKNYLHIVEVISPVMKKREFEMKRLLVGSPAFSELPPKYEVFKRNVKCDIDLFREENIPLMTEDDILSQRYQKITGGWLIDWDGEQLTRQQVMAKLDEPDRSLRERAYHAWAGPHLADREKLDEIYDKMLELRGRIAGNAGFENFRDYQFKAYKHFDYTPDDCFSFHKSIKALVVPLVNKLSGRRKEKMGLDTVRPWDLSADENGLPPIKPFNGSEELKEKVHGVAKNIDPELGGFFEVMRETEMLDLDSRKGKAPGGYMADFNERRLPFIFMNAVGTQRDVETLLHESGHAYNLFLDRELEPIDYLQPPMEFAEVASMSMELLAWPYLDLIYKPDELVRVKRQQLANVLKFMPFMAMIDTFQHWAYLNDSTPTGRADYWEKLEDEFRPHIDWSGLEDVKRLGWQYLHVFEVPFYYIEYGIAQLGALQVWSKSGEDFEKAVENYKSGLSLGGSRTLPELFEAVGARFDMTEATLGPLMQRIERELGL